VALVAAAVCRVEVPALLAQDADAAVHHELVARRAPGADAREVCALLAANTAAVAEAIDGLEPAFAAAADAGLVILREHEARVALRAHPGQARTLCAVRIALHAAGRDRSDQGRDHHFSATALDAARVRLVDRKAGRAAHALRGGVLAGLAGVLAAVSFPARGVHVAPAQEFALARNRVDEAAFDALETLAGAVRAARAVLGTDFAAAVEVDEEPLRGTAAAGEVVVVEEEAARTARAEGRRERAGLAGRVAAVALAVYPDHVARSAVCAAAVARGERLPGPAGHAVRGGRLAAQAVRRAGLAAAARGLEELPVPAHRDAVARGVHREARRAGRAVDRRAARRAVRVALVADGALQHEACSGACCAPVRRVLPRLSGGTARTPRARLLAGRAVRRAPHEGPLPAPVSRHEASG